MPTETPAAPVSPTTPEVPPTIVSTPPPVPPPAPEAKLYPTTPGDPAAPAPPSAPPPSTTPEPPKPPTDPTKPVDPASPPTAPTEYDLKLPEGSLLSAEDLAAIAKDAKAAGLTKEEAEAHVKEASGIVGKTVARLQAQQETVHQAEQAKWPDLVKADSELGGDRYNETVALASRGFKATASLELQKLIEQTGLGNHPEYVRQMAKIGRLMGEDKLVLGQVGGSPAPRDPAAVLYGKTTPDGTGRKS